jgi:hypothetical protein
MENINDTIQLYLINVTNRLGKPTYYTEIETANNGFRIQGNEQY